MNQRKRVLILCTGNSARSQMAEGLLRELAGDVYEVESAGVAPSSVRAEAVAVMQELGIDISSQRSKSVDQFRQEEFDYVITVCDNAREQCPVFPGKAKRIHWSFDDPAAAEGDEHARLAVFRRVRDEIQERLREFMTENNQSNLLEGWQESAKYWAQHRETIHAMFTPLTEGLIETAQIREGQQVLDVAGGAGDPSLTIAGLVGPNGRVTFTDAVAQMVETARGEASRRGISNLDFNQCVADALPFPANSFDVVVSRLGVMLFPDPLAAVREMLRVLKPSGRLAFAVWHKSELNPFCYVVSNVIDQYIKTPPADPDAPGAFRFAEPGKLAAVMKQAGAIDVEDFVFSFDMAAPISPLQFWLMRSQTSDTLREKLAQLSSGEQAVVTAKVEHGVKEFFPGNEMKFPTLMIIATGKKLG